MGGASDPQAGRKVSGHNYGIWGNAICNTNKWKRAPRAALWLGKKGAHDAYEGKPRDLKVTTISDRIPGSATDSVTWLHEKKIPPKVWEVYQISRNEAREENKDRRGETGRGPNEGNRKEYPKVSKAVAIGKGRQLQELGSISMQRMRKKP